MTEEGGWPPVVRPRRHPGGRILAHRPGGPLTEGRLLVRNGDRGHILWWKGGALHGREDRPRVADLCREASLEPLPVAVRRGKACFDTALPPDPPAGRAAPP